MGPILFILGLMALILSLSFLLTAIVALGASDD